MLLFWLSIERLNLFSLYLIDHEIGFLVIVLFVWTPE